MKKLSLVVFCLSFILLNDNCFAQNCIDTLKAEKEQIGQHTIYAEGLGNAYWGWYSIGYDYTLKLKPKHKLSFNFGINSYFVIPILTLAPQISYLYGKKHHLELGVGATYWMNISNPVYYTGMWYIPFRIGYRYQRENGGFFFKIAYMPGFWFDRHYEEDRIIPIKDFTPYWGGVAFGYTFKNKKK